MEQAKNQGYERLHLQTYVVNYRLSRALEHQGFSRILKQEEGSTASKLVMERGKLPLSPASRQKVYELK